MVMERLGKNQKAQTTGKAGGVKQLKTTKVVEEVYAANKEISFD